MNEIRTEAYTSRRITKRKRELSELKKYKNNYDLMD